MILQGSSGTPKRAKILRSNFVVISEALNSFSRNARRESLQASRPLRQSERSNGPLQWRPYDSPENLRVEFDILVDYDVPAEPLFNYFVRPVDYVLRGVHDGGVYGFSELNGVLRFHEHC